jgi:triacylglycerol esterase/lipase EstA (alpha/beta hydrolase family)
MPHFSDVGPLSFKAMAPIVLVHGWLSGPWAWGPKPAVANLCTPNPENASDGGENFVQALIDAKVPFDCTFLTLQQSPIAFGAEELTTQLQTILASFGTRHVNLVSHSKGGLFARQFLQENVQRDPTAQIGLVSLTTINTPHHGSVLSDTVVAAREGHSVLPGIVRPFYFILNRIDFFGDGNPDMTISEMRDFNNRFFAPPPEFTLQRAGTSTVWRTRPSYYSTSADADLDGNGQISAAEAAPSSHPTLVANFRYKRLGTVRAIELRQQGGRQVAVFDSAPSGFFYKNDLAVTIDSAKYSPMFTEIYSYLGISGRNHTTIKRPDIAAYVLQKIREAEARQQ